MAYTAAHLMQKPLWWWQCSGRYSLPLPQLHCPRLFGDNSALNKFNQPTKPTYCVSIQCALYLTHCVLSDWERIGGALIADCIISMSMWLTAARFLNWTWQQLWSAFVRPTGPLWATSRRRSPANFVFTLRASLSGTFLRTLPDLLVTPQ